jgi:hypothetical protein
MSFKKKINYKHKNKKSKKLNQKIKGGVGPSIFGNLQRYFSNASKTQNEIKYINDLKQKLKNNNEQIKKNVDEYGSLHKEMFDRIQSLDSKLEELTTIQSKCSELYPQINNSDDKSETVGENFNLFFDNAKNTIEQQTESLQKQGTEFASNLANSVPFSDSKKLQTKIDELEQENKTLILQNKQLKTGNKEEQTIISNSLKTPISETELDNLDNEEQKMGEEPQSEEPEMGEEPQGEEPQGEEPQGEEPQSEEPEMGEEPQGEEPEMGKEPQSQEPEMGEEPQGEEPEMWEEKKEEETPSNNYLIKTNSDIQEVPKKNIPEKNISEKNTLNQQAGKKKYKSKKRRKHNIKKSKSKKNMDTRFYL